MTDADIVQAGMEVFGVAFMVGFATQVLLGMLYIALAIIRKLAGIS